jgi:hypothetical protein
MAHRFVAGALLACVFVAFGAALPASASGGGAPKVRVVGSAVTHENSFASVDVRYRCATGTTATMYVSVRQGSAADPSAFFDTASYYSATPLVCDGDKHVSWFGMVALGGSETDPGLYGYLQDTSVSGLRGVVTAVITDTTTGRTDTDVDRVVVESR